MPENISMNFRDAQPEDVKTILALVSAAYAKWIPVIGREPKPMNADYEKALREHDFALLCIGEEIAGLIETMTRDDHIWIENVAVSPAQQGMGLGRRLLQHAEEIAKRSGRTKLSLLTNADFKANVTFYEKVGYVTTSTEPFMGGTTVYMTKTLEGDAQSPTETD
ncbi:GNAT family N-acetyltransferase [Nisaea nitritireducens]|uniref:GNAT family N-acetyltransferase n=1 Tax=Nisaea nitritireducens TaxID=568392 RepID=UPI0018694100|nr:GNAT family N-acetyltransferase [Nisaea nitritireducens]